MIIYRLKEFIKEQLINIPTPRAPAPMAPQAQPTMTPPAPAASDPGAILAGLL